TIEHRLALVAAGPAEARPRSRLETPQLAPQLMALFLPEVLYVRFEIGGERHPRARDQTFATHGVAAHAQLVGEHTQRGYVLGDVLETHAGRAIADDPARHGPRDLRGLTRRGDDVLFIG